MTRSFIQSIRLAVAIGVGVAGLCWSGNIPTNGSTSFVSTAKAIIGRPATPMSYAGVARRSTARAVTYGAAAGAAAAARCRQVANPYTGQISMVCY